jgi:hypothetical protein
MAYVTKSITARIDWCRRQSTQACVPLESAGWRAEAEGLEDALLHRDHTNQYQQQGPPSVFVRYVTGLQDGRALIRTGAVKRRATSAVWNASGEAVNHIGSGEPI